MGLAWSDCTESVADGSVVTGRVSNAGQIKGDDPDEKGYPGSPCWGLGVSLTTSPPPKKVDIETTSEIPRED